MEWTLSCVVALLTVDVVMADGGTSFVVTFPQSYAGKTPDCSLQIAAVDSGQAAQGHVRSPTTEPGALDQDFKFEAGKFSKVVISDESKVLPVGSLVSSRTLEVTSSTNVTLTVVNIAASNGDAYTAIPVSDLGTEYYVVTGAKVNPQTASFLTVSAPHDDTQVNVTMPASSDASEQFHLQGVTFFFNDVITVKLKRLETLQLQSAQDMTGARVVSSKPVSVLSGQNRTNLGGSQCQSHIMAEMPPVDHWGSAFVLVHLPNQTAGDRYRFVASQPLTTVNIGGTESSALMSVSKSSSDAASGPVVKKTLRLQNAGDFAEFDLDDGVFVFAASDKPVLVTQYTREQKRVESGDKPTGDPSLSVLSPLAHARDRHRLVLDQTPVYVVFTIRAADVTALRVNGRDVADVSNVTWHTVVGQASYVVGHVVLAKADMPCTLGKEGGPEFTAHAYYSHHCECSAMTLTHGQPQKPMPSSTCPTASQSPGDGVDNDCDGRVDEEPCCVNTQPADTDGDQYKNEDCQATDTLQCCTSTGQSYACKELQRSSLVTETPRYRRLAETITPLKVKSKIACATTCLRTTGCWGVNFDPESRQGHNCETLSGRGVGLVDSAGWGFQSIVSQSVYTAP